MASTSHKGIRGSLRELYLSDPRPWLVGFSGGKDTTLAAALVFDAILFVPPKNRTKTVKVLYTDTSVEIPAISEGLERMFDRTRRFSERECLNIEAHLLKPTPEQSFWVNIIGRGYPPPNRIFRWCIQRIKIDSVTSFAQQRLQNGLALSENAHWIFDVCLWSLDDNYTVIVAERSFDEVGEVAYFLKCKAGQQVYLPGKRNYRPGIAHLTWNREYKFPAD